MIAIWRTWMKLLLLAGLIVGCNIIAPGLATASAQAAAPAESCHHSDRKGEPAGMALCKASCLAIAPAVSTLAAPPLVSAPLHPAPLASLIALHAVPDTPPPRG